MAFQRSDNSLITGHREFDTPSKALEDMVHPDPYVCDTYEEKIEHIADTTAEALGRLMDILHQKNIISDADVVTVLGYGWGATSSTGA